MTSKEKLDWIAKATPIVKAFLVKKLGYPKCSNEIILKNLDLMWAELGTNNLILEGMTFQTFVETAHRKYMEREMWRIIGL